MKKKWIALAVIFFLTIVAAVMAVNMMFPVRHLDVVRDNAGQLDVPLILAVIRAESSFRENAYSHAGAQGLMQLMAPTAAEVAQHMGLDFKPEDVWDAEINIAMGSFYLNRLYSLFGCVELALAAYNAGQGRVKSWLADPKLSSDGVNLDDIGDIPFEETRNYVRRVIIFQNIYRIILWVTGRS